MGSSKDAVSDGYECTDRGDCLPKSAKKTRCWACHESGAINMKELVSPWNSWAPNDIKDRPIFDKFGTALGQRKDAVDLQTRTENAHADWNTQRRAILKGKGVAETLRPLFCTLTLNLRALGRKPTMLLDTDFFVTEGSPLGNVGFFGDRVALDMDEYAAAIKANGQKVVDGDGNQLVGPSGPITESPNGFIFPGKGNIDIRYVRALVEANVIDRDFGLDVLHVDFTRAILSPTRCGLLDAAPELDAANMTPDKIREGFKANLANRKDAASALLLKNLGDPNDAEAYQAEVSAFFTACSARPKGDFVKEVLQYNAQLKFAAKGHRAKTPDGAQGFLEFAETLPVDNLSDTNKFFDAVTCTLK